MKIRVFTLNKNNKIELTEDELKKLLDESYQDGRNDARTATISTPSYPYWYYSTTTTGCADDLSTTTYNLKTEASADGTVTI